MRKNNLQKGFTLVEIMVVVAIIGIMAGVITVSMKDSVDRSKRASALTTASSVLPEIVTCEDDGGSIVHPNHNENGGGTICGGAAGHTATWPNISTTGWTYNVADTTNANIAAMSFTLTRASQPTITCTVASNGCI